MLYQYLKTFALACIKHRLLHHNRSSSKPFHILNLRVLNTVFTSVFSSPIGVGESSSWYFNEAMSSRLIGSMYVHSVLLQTLKLLSGLLYLKLRRVLTKACHIDLDNTPLRIILTYLADKATQNVSRSSSILF